MVIHGSDWCMGSKMLTTTYFLVMSGYKFGLTQTTFSHPDWVCSAWFRQFTAFQPFQSFTISILNVQIWLRMEFFHHNHHHILPFVSRVVKILAPGPYVPHQDWVCTDWFSHFISAWPFQSLIISIMNGHTWFRLVVGLYKAHQNLFSGHEWVQFLLVPYALFAPRLRVYWLI